MVCGGVICVEHKTLKTTEIGRYASGQKRCQICSIFIRWNGIYCPCCGCKLRTKPRRSKHK